MDYTGHLSNIDSFPLPTNPKVPEFWEKIKKTATKIHREQIMMFTVSYAG